MIDILGNLLIFCHLTIASGASSLSNHCSGSWSTENHGVLTAKHCLNNSKNPNDYLIIAECNNKTWEFDEAVDFIFSNNANDDVVIIKFNSSTMDKSSNLNNEIKISKYKAMYFAENNKLAKNVKCYFIDQFEKLIEISTHNEIFLNFNNKIEVKPLKESGIVPYFMNYGDSGGPLICKTRGPFAYEIIGIASTFQTEKENPLLKIGNTYTPIFSAF